MHHVFIFHVIQRVNIPYMLQIKKVKKVIYLNTYYNFVIEYYTCYNYYSLTIFFFLGVKVYTIGEPTCICQYFDAILWKESVKWNKNPKFSIYCMHGTVVPKITWISPIIAKLSSDKLRSRSAHFKKNIRVYNSIFTFTSIEGYTDLEINKILR